MPRADASFKHLWSDNGDALSHQYAGTGLPPSFALSCPAVFGTADDEASLPAALQVLSRAT